MGTTVKQRLIEYLGYKGVGQVKFAKNVGLSNGFVHNIVNSIQPKTIDKITKYYTDLNAAWLLTGEGEMLKDPALHKATPCENGNILYYPNVDGSMGDTTFCDEPDERTCLKMVIPGYEDCTHAVNVWGDSMSPLIESGQIIVMKLWEESFFDWGNIYFIVTKGGYRTTKRVYPSDREGFVQLRSENAAKHPPFEIERADIARCFLVKGWICRSVI